MLTLVIALISCVGVIGASLLNHRGRQDHGGGAGPL